MTVIATSPIATATAYSNQRKIDRCQNGVLWAVHTGEHSGSSGSISVIGQYSTDDGATWTEVPDLAGWWWGSGYSYTFNMSFFIDVDDYAHLVLKNASNGYIYYNRGTPNAARTAWTWSAASVVANAQQYNYADVIAHKEGSGWTAHTVFSYFNGATDNRAAYARVDITSGGGITPQALSFIGGSYSSYGHTYPSIDFNHTGDGKTVAGGTPHLYVAWSAGATGSGKGIRFKKATYSSGSWTWGTEREIDSTRYVDHHSRWLTCLFDGTRVVLSGNVYNGSSRDVMIYDRDVADTTTTTYVLAASTNFYYGSATYDASGNVFFIGAVSGLGYRKWTRATTTFESPVVVDSTDINNPYVSAKRGYSEGRIEFIYTDGTASPYEVMYGPILLGPSGPFLRTASGLLRTANGPLRPRSS